MGDREDRRVGGRELGGRDRLGDREVGRMGGWEDGRMGGREVRLPATQRQYVDESTIASRGPRTQRPPAPKGAVSMHEVHAQGYGGYEFQADKGQGVYDDAQRVPLRRGRDTCHAPHSFTASLSG